MGSEISLFPSPRRNERRRVTVLVLAAASGQRRGQQKAEVLEVIRGNIVLKKAQKSRLGCYAATSPQSLVGSNLLVAEKARRAEQEEEEEEEGEGLRNEVRSVLTVERGLYGQKTAGSSRATSAYHLL